MLHERRGDKRAPADLDPQTPLLGTDLLPPAALQALLALHAQLRPPPMTEPQRRSASPVMLRSAARLTTTVSTFHGRHGAELPELRDLPVTLTEQQQSADRLRLLRANLELLLQRANDAYLDAQQQAVRQARAVLRRVHTVSTWHSCVSAEFLLRQALLARAAAFDHRAPGHRRPARRPARTTR